MDSLSELRASINSLDETLLRILAQRLAVARAIARKKAECGLPIHQPEREAEVISALTPLAASLGIPPDHLHVLYTAIFALSAEVQNDEIFNTHSSH